MMVVVAYDIETGDGEGKTRLRRMEKLCRKWGVMVQRSVYECKLDAEKYRAMKAEVGSVINSDKDEVRFYNLGNRFAGRIEQIGKVKSSWDWETYVI